MHDQKDANEDDVGTNTGGGGRPAAVSDGRHINILTLTIILTSTITLTLSVQ